MRNTMVILSAILLLLFSGCAARETVSPFSDFNALLPDAMNISKNFSPVTRTTPEQGVVEENQTELPEANPSDSSQKLILQELLVKAPNAYSFDGVVVNGNRRAFVFGDFELWDLDAKKYYERAGLVDAFWYNEIRSLPPPRGLDANKYHMAYFEYNISDDERISEGNDSFAPIYPLGPIDLMEEYVDVEPILVENKSRFFRYEGPHIFEYQLSLKFPLKEDPQKTIVFMIDPKFDVPTGVEVLEAGEAVARWFYWFETIQAEEVEKSMSLEDDYVIITPEEWEEYKELKDDRQ